MGESITLELLAMLKSWLINHIRSDDNDYIKTVKVNMGEINMTQDDG